MPPQQNTGSFMSPAGASADPIMEAITRRQMGASPTTAQSSMSQTPTPAAIPQGAPSAIPPEATGAPQMGVSGNIAGMPPQPAESELIIRALSDRLKTFSKIEESQAIPPKPPTLQAPAAI